MAYRFEATSVEGFIQQLACSYLPHGYMFYVAGRVPEGKDPAAVDEKLLTRYEIDISKWARARRKKAGLANLHYLRFGRTFVLVATAGRHPFFTEEAAAIRDIRKVPIRLGGYSVSFRRGADGKFHPHVRMDEDHYRGLKAYLLGLAVHRRAEALVDELWRVPFEPYAPVRRQLFNILRAVNRARKVAGFERVPYAAVPMRRRVVKPFGDALQNKEAA